MSIKNRKIQNLIQRGIEKKTEEFVLSQEIFILTKAPLFKLIISNTTNI